MTRRTRVLAWVWLVLGVVGGVPIYASLGDGDNRWTVLVFEALWTLPLCAGSVAVLVYGREWGRGLLAVYSVLCAMACVWGAVVLFHFARSSYFDPPLGVTGLIAGAALWTAFCAYSALSLLGDGPRSAKASPPPASPSP